MTEKSVFQLTVRDAAIGGVGVMQVTGPVGAYRFRFRYVFGTASGVLDETAVSEVCRSAERAVYRWSVPDALAAQLPEAVRGMGTMTAEACDGETCVDSGQAAFAAYVPASVKPTAALETAVVSDIPAVQAWGLCVQGLSRVQYSVTAAGADGAAVRACRFSFGGQEKTGLSGVTDTIAAAGMMTPEAVVTDSRGRSVTVAGDAVEVYAYHPPVILSGSAVRCDADGAEADGGGYLKVCCHAVCADVAGHNTVAVRARWRAAGGAWSAGTVLTDGQETVLPGGFAARLEYDRLYLTDRSPAASFSPVTLSPGETVLIPALGLRVECRIEENFQEKAKTLSTFAVKYDTIEQTPRITIRPRQAHDVIHTAGGTKTLKKLLIDRKVPAAQRALVPVAADASGVLGVYGIGVDLGRAAAPGERAVIITIEETEKEDKMYD